MFVLGTLAVFAVFASHVKSGIKRMRTGLENSNPTNQIMHDVNTTLRGMNVTRAQDTLASY